jgi:hypothetical protein
MKRILGIIILALAVTALTPVLVAQTEERGEFGVFADYTRLHHFNNANLWGPGAQISFNLGQGTIGQHVQLEASMAYDFARDTICCSTDVATNFTNERLRLLHGFFGPKFQTGVGPVKAFVFVKGGLLNFSVSRRGAGTGFTNAVNNVPNGDTNGVFYPGGGVEFFAHRFGLRAEVGDEMYFDNGANHNLKIQAGPVFRF